MPETTPETCAPAKDSPFFIKNLLNCDSKPSKPRPMFAPAKVGLEGGFSLSQVGDLHFPRFDFPTQRFALPAYLERASAWWYPYTISPSSHLHRATEGMYTILRETNTYSKAYYLFKSSQVKFMHISKQLALTKVVCLFQLIDDESVV